MDIQNELKKFNVIDSDLEELKNEYMQYKIVDFNDFGNIEKVKTGIKLLTKHRNAIEKRRKELVADALETQRKINAEAKRVISVFEPVETHLRSLQKKVDDEHTEYQRQQELKEEEKIKSRIASLTKIDFHFDGVYFTSAFLDSFENKPLQKSMLDIKTMEESLWSDFFTTANYEYEMDKREKLKLEEERRLAAEDIERQKNELAQKEREINKREVTLKAAEQKQIAKAAMDKINENIAAGRKLTSQEFRTKVETDVKNTVNDTSSYIELEITAPNEDEVELIDGEVEIAITIPEGMKINPVKRDLFIEPAYLARIYEPLSEHDINKILFIIENTIDQAIKTCISEAVQQVMKN